jgi:hypothetical protein
MSLSPYVVAGYSMFWRFPSAVERLAYEPVAVEVDRLAHQLDDNTVWLLASIEPTVWTSFSGDDGNVANDEYSGDPLVAYNLAKAP